MKRVIKMDIREGVCDSILEFEEDCNTFELRWAIDYLQKSMNDRNSEPKKDFKKSK